MNAMIRAAERHQLLQNDLAQRPVRGTRREIDHVPAVLLVLPMHEAAWLLTEIDNEDDNLAFGLADLGQGFPEMGSVWLPELGDLRVGPLRVIQDTSFKTDHTLTWWAREARARQSLMAALREHQATRLV